MLNKEQLKIYCNACAEKYDISAAMFEKDYYIDLILRELVKKEPKTVFKGGVSLTVAHKTSYRMSQDVDVTLFGKNNSQTQKKIYNRVIEDVCFDILKFKRIEEEQNKIGKKNWGDSNIYFVDYEPIFGDKKNYHIEVDCSFITQVDEVEKIKIKPLIAEFLNIEDGIEKTLDSFEIYVQKTEMIIADKLFAICKSVCRKHFEDYSRHFYDIYNAFIKKIKGKKEEKLKEFIKKVEEQEKERYKNNPNVIKNNMVELLEIAIKSKEFEKDYNERLKATIFNTKINNPSFEDCCQVIKYMIKNEFFKGIIHYFVPKNKKDNKTDKQKIYIYEADTTKGGIMIRGLNQEEYKSRFANKDSFIFETKIKKIRDLLFSPGLYMIYEKMKYIILETKMKGIYLIFAINSTKEKIYNVLKKNIKK